MKKILIVLLFLFILMPFNVKASENIDLYLFYSETCMHCKEEMQFLDSIKDQYPRLNLHYLESIKDKTNVNLVKAVKKGMKVNSPLLPFTVIGTNYYIGFNEDVKEKISQNIEKYLNGDYTNVVEKVNNGESLKGLSFNDDEITEITLPLLGKINPRNIALPLVAIILGTIDGFNPCAMWVLIFLISMLFNMKNKKRMWILGMTFLFSSALIYLLFMIAWLNLAETMISVVWLRTLIAFIALIGSYVNIRSYINSLKKDDGCEVVDDKKRKSLMTKIRKVTSEKSFILAIIGIIILSFSVNLIELACSAGLPLMFTQILALNNLSTASYSGLILLYILFFLIDDIVIFTIAMLTLNIKAISTKYTKYSHLVGGIIMLIIGLLMMFKPEWLMFNFG